MAPFEDGVFLVRESANYPGDYTLCVAYEGKVEHYHISIKDNRLTVDDETFFSNMVQLVEVRIWHYLHLQYLNYLSASTSVAHTL